MTRLDPLYLQATTACLVAIVVMQVANVFVCRSPTRSVLAQGPLGNPLILAGIAAELAITLLIVYTGPGNSLFGTSPLPASLWLFPLPFALAMVLAEEGRKALTRDRQRS